MKRLIKIKSIFLIVLFASLTGCSLNKNGSDNNLSEESKIQQIDGIRISEKSLINKEHKNVLIISGSPRKGGNSDLLCDEFAKGAEEVGGNVEKIFLADYNIKYFEEEDEQRVGDHSHEADDDAPALMDKLVDADIVVLSSPAYYLNVTGQMKVFIDRTFSHLSKLKDKEFYYIVTSADTSDKSADRTIDGFRGFVMCLPNSVERGHIKGLGLGRKGAVKDSQYMQEAYELGKTI